MNGFSARLDDYSIQIMNSNYPKFYIRCDTGRTSDKKIAITDLIYDENFSIAFDGLNLLWEHLPTLGPSLAVEIGDILPSRSANNAQLVSRHDELVRLISSWLTQRGYYKVDSRLIGDSTFEKFTSLVCFRNLKVLPSA